MNNKLLEKTAPPIEPLYDTWGIKKDVGSWCIALSLSFASLSTNEVNNWFSVVLSGTLDAFSNLARAWRIYFNSLYRDDVGGISLEWQPGDSYENYLETVLKAIQEYPAPIYSLDVEVDLLAYFRTKEFPDVPVRAWVRVPSQFTFWGGPENSKPYLCFDIEHTLFRLHSKDSEDNKVLYSLNQPLLEESLRRWEEHFGSIQDIDGLSGIFQYGFLEEAENSTQ